MISPSRPNSIPPGKSLSPMNSPPRPNTIPSDQHSSALDLSDKTQYALQCEEEIATASSLVEPEEV
ncbi:unnamed protein product [Arabis nemorensis]|uniref:Uncharacterized protein n=1 Tax=Arabis nemorensis TaxID=586526 RepID=A0A565AQY7_9BRAS|nr:unnamed protein product [Arabis nemorensis]